MLIAIVFLAGGTRANTIVFPAQTGQTLDQAFLWAESGDSIVVRNGTYRGSFFVKPGIILKAEAPGNAIFDGGGRGIVMTLGLGAQIQGLTIQNGTVGVFSKHAKTVIRNCRIVRNWQSGIICVRHLPEITNNVIAFNRASGIKCYGVKSTAGASKISHNCIAFNRRNGLTIDGNSEATVEYNIIAHNSRFGLYSAHEQVRLTVSSNDFYDNLTVLEPFPKGNFSYDPVFTSPKGLLDFTSKGNCKECVPGQMPGLQADSERSSSSSYYQ
jgi:nitrous oxidase accessory protein NosD